MTTGDQTYPSQRSRSCPMGHYVGLSPYCPICGHVDRDKLEDRLIAHAESRGYGRPIIDESSPAIVSFTERELRGLECIRHARLYGVWRPCRTGPV